MIHHAVNPEAFSEYEVEDRDRQYSLPEPDEVVRERDSLEVFAFLNR